MERGAEAERVPLRSSGLDQAAAYLADANRAAAPDDLPDAALPAAADYIRDVAAELEARDREAGQ